MNLEIRTIQEHESEKFLKLMCEVFELDFQRASYVFFKEPFFDLKRKWVATSNGEFVGCLTTVPMQFGYCNAIGIAGVAVAPNHRNKGIAGALLDEVTQYSNSNGETHALLFAKDVRLYEKHGFHVLDNIIIANINQPPPSITVFPITHTEIQEIYNRWSQQDKKRLVRDETRWHHWEWHLKTSYRTENGYACIEGNKVREVIPEYTSLPASDRLQWHGLESMANFLNIPIQKTQSDTILMGKNFDFVPQMFLTDQF